MSTELQAALERARVDTALRADNARLRAERDRLTATVDRVRALAEEWVEAGELDGDENRAGAWRYAAGEILTTLERA